MTYVELKNLKDEMLLLSKTKVTHITQFRALARKAHELKKHIPSTLTQAEKGFIGPAIAKINRFIVKDYQYEQKRAAKAAKERAAVFKKQQQLWHKAQIKREAADKKALDRILTQYVKTKNVQQTLSDIARLLGH